MIAFVGNDNVLAVYLEIYTLNEVTKNNPFLTPFKFLHVSFHSVLTSSARSRITELKHREPERSICKVNNGNNI